MIEECVIIGGGVAGLTAACRLAELGISPLIIEGGEFPCHRICGEYISHEGIPILNQLGIQLTGKICRSRFIKGSRTLEFELPIHAGSCSRYELDQQLYQTALQKGARGLCKTTVVSLNRNRNGNYELELSNNERIEARKLVIGTGKIPKALGIKAAVPVMSYAGFKAHFEGVELDDAIEMHLIPGGYLGMAKISENVTNVAALVVQKPEFEIEKILKTESVRNRLKNTKRVFQEWLVGKVPEFGIRNTPKWDRVFWIGDAAGGIPPVSGEGLAIAITSGWMAAEYVARGDAKQFRQDWLKRYRGRYFWARQIHRILCRQWLSGVGFGVAELFPGLPLHLWRWTREANGF